MKSKNAIASAGVAVYVILIAYTMLMLVTKRTLYISGFFLSEFSFAFAVIAVLMFIQLIMKCASLIGRKKEERAEKPDIFDVVTTVVPCIILIFAIWGLVRDVSGTATNEVIDLIGGKQVLLHEKTNQRTGDVSIYVYQINGINAERLGEIAESYLFSNKCIEEGNWDHTYDVGSGLLTIVCFYDEAGEFIDEEHDTGVWKEEFTLTH